MELYHNIKHTIFDKENRALLIIFPLVFTVMMSFGFFLWGMNLIILEDCGCGRRIHSRQKSCIDTTQSNRAFIHSQKTIDEMTDKAVTFIEQSNNGINLSHLIGSSTIAKAPNQKVVKRPQGKKGVGLCCGRSKESVTRTVRGNLSSLQYAYLKRLKENPDIGSKIELKWAIDDFGTVPHCKIVSSTLNDPIFEEEIIRRIKSWSFGNSPHPGEIIELTYPFVFTK